MRKAAKLFQICLAHTDGMIGMQLAAAFQEVFIYPNCAEDR